MKRVNWSATLLATAAGLASLNCAAVLGIEDATLAEEDGDGGNAGTSASMDSGGTGGSGGDDASGGTGGSGGEQTSGGGGGSGGYGGTGGFAGAGGYGGYGGTGGSPGTGGYGGYGGTGGSPGTGGYGGYGGTGASPGTGGTGGQPQRIITCQEYCDTVMSACTDADAVYASEAVCLNLCELYEVGEAGDSGNTLHCRLAQAESARDTGEPEVHCPSAGLGGNDVCGTNCDGYCTAMMPTCVDGFDTLDDCLTACADVPDLGTNSADITSGDSVQCLIWHVGAATVATVPHCEHAAGGVAPCQ